MKTLTTLAAFLLLSSVAHAGGGTATVTVPLKGDQLFPEGIIALPNEDLLVGGFGDGSIQRIDPKNVISSFSKSGDNGMVIAVGFALDEKHQRLWVANFNFKTESGLPGSNLKVFDYTTGKLLKTIPETFVQGAFFNELALDAKGNVYVSDTFNPSIWTATFDSKGPKVFVTEDALLKNPSPDQAFGLNGLALTPDENYLIASVMNRTIRGGGRLVRVALKTKAVSEVELHNDDATAAFSGSDGMFFHRGQLLMVNVYSQAGAIVTAKFNSTYSAASLTLRTKFQHVYDRPTASAIRGGKLYTVNSQLNHIIDDRDGQLNTPPSLPFQIVAVPLGKLLRP